MSEVVLGFKAQPYRCEDCWLDSGREVRALVRMMPEVHVLHFGERKEFVGAEAWCCPVCFRPKNSIRKSKADQKNKDPEEIEYNNKWGTIYGGYVRKYRLCEWWDSNFSASEKSLIRRASKNKTVDGVNSHVPGGWSVVDWLCNFGSRTLGTKNVTLAVRFIDQALQFVETKDIPKAFAVHAQKIDLVYAASRGDHELFPHLVRACEQMIDYSMSFGLQY
jgi:hypothetical protein